MTIVFGLTLIGSIVFARPENRTSAPLVIGHRGASYLAPENTMSSVKLAWRLGASAEVDVHLTKDRRVVVLHDSNTKRTSGVEKKVSNTNYDDLRRLDVGSYKDAAFKGEKIPLLSEVLAALPINRILFVEIKCGKEIVPYLDAVLNRSNRRDQVVIIGFNLNTITEAKKRMADRPTYWLRPTYRDRRTKRRKPHDPRWIEKVKQRGLDGLDVHCGGVNKRFVDAVKASGLKLYVWTVDDRETARRLARFGVDGITTNRPERLLQRDSDILATK